MSTGPCKYVCSIIPPHILLKLMESEVEGVRDAALNTLLTTANLRGERSVRATRGFAIASPTNGRRTIFDCRNSRFLNSAVLSRSENDASSSDEAINRVYDGFGTTREFYRKVFDRNSIDGFGMQLDGYVHYSVKYNNAFWDGDQMIFGDGDSAQFTDFTKSLDVIAHELTHGVTEKTAGLVYHFQPGALNESISDVFGSLVKQWILGQPADAADWLIGAEVFTPDIDADALRSLKAPGTAYDNAIFGKDPQPDHMNRFVQLPDTDRGDWGGVHINSGIPNKAFYLASVAIGGNAWDAPGHIWYESLRASHETTDFQEFADTTYAKAGQLYGAGSNEQQSVHSAWKEVGVRVSGVQPMAIRSRSIPSPLDEGSDSLLAMNKQIEALAKQVKALTKEVRSMKANT